MSPFLAGPRTKPPPDTRWMKWAACRGLDPNLFFPEKGDGSRGVKDVCRPCPVRQECLDYAIETSQWKGVWGGTTERERKAIRRNRRKQELSEQSASSNGHSKGAA